MSIRIFHGHWKEEIEKVRPGVYQTQHACPMQNLFFCQYPEATFSKWESGKCHFCYTISRILPKGLYRLWNEDGNLATGSTLAVELPPAQVQQGGVDCGLFAIAFAYELAAETTLWMYRAFEQGKMREHLVKCLERGLFEPFPRNKVIKIQQKTKLWH